MTPAMMFSVGTILLTNGLAMLALLTLTIHIHKETPPKTTREVGLIKEVFLPAIAQVFCIGRSIR